MKSTITKLYDYTQVQIPERSGLWRVGDEEIRKHLETLAHDCAYLEDVEEVQHLDAVLCRGVSSIARWNRPNLQFYPGRGLCEAAIENACIGKKVGETYTASVEDGEVTLTVEQIVRQTIPPMNDELVRIKGPEGVDTVADYYRWYREQNEPGRYQSALEEIAYTLLEETAKNSVFSLDQEEKDAWCKEEGERLYRMWSAAGMAPTLSDDGTFLTEEEALAKVQVAQEPQFLVTVTAAYLVETVGGQSLEQVYSQYMADLATEATMPADAGTNDALSRDMAYVGAATKLLYPCAKKWMEE